MVIPANAGIQCKRPIVRLWTVRVQVEVNPLPGIAGGDIVEMAAASALDARVRGHDDFGVRAGMTTCSVHGHDDVGVRAGMTTMGYAAP